MSIIIALILGGIVGYIASRVMGRNEGIFASIIIGIVGAIIGKSIAGAIGSGTTAYLAFSWSGLVWSFIGAIILVAILNAFQHRSNHHHQY
jgi:uncharacterized membrane protein YeaQ/YmgE (transglycosylase-associated protein family)